MAVSTISTYSILQSTLNDVSRVEAELQQQQIQLSSGNKSRDFAGLGDQVQQFLALDASIRKADQYINDNQVVEDRMNATGTALTGIIDTATVLQSLIAQRRTGVGNSAAFETQLRGVWNQLVGQLNTTVSNQFIFSGTQTSTPSVDGQAFPTLQVAGVPDIGYYRGNQQDVTARPQDNNNVTYNVRADDEGIQKLFAALAMARQGHTNGNDVDLQAAYTLVQEGLTGVINTQAKLNANKVLFASIDKQLLNTKLYWRGLQESIGNTDILSVSTQVAINQGLLQAAFQAFAKISSLRLSDFLR